ncbi:hypothetical protein MMC34_002386 [Xylographa carneopallida]|nr:hypothetical protein [Xylographa carneopallida]
MAMNLIFYVAHNFVLIFQCNPVAKGWDSSIPGVCLDQVALLESSGPFNIISDLLIFLLPLSSIWQLKLPLKTRLGIGSAFAIGLFGCICSAVRLYYSNKLNSSGDATYLVFQNQLWANTEITISVLIANVIILPRFIRSKRRTGSNYDYAHKTSSRNHRTTKFTQRHPSSDPYIELTEGDSNTARREDASYDDEHKTGRGTVQGIMRTIQIDTIEEKVYAPKSTATNNFQVDVVTEVTSSGTRT